MVSLSGKLFPAATSYYFLVNGFVAARVSLSLDTQWFGGKISPCYFDQQNEGWHFTDVWYFLWAKECSNAKGRKGLKLVSYLPFWLVKVTLWACRCKARKKVLTVHHPEVWNNLFPFSRQMEEWCALLRATKLFDIPL